MGVRSVQVGGEREEPSPREGFPPTSGLRGPQGNLGATARLQPHSEAADSQLLQLCTAEREAPA